MFTDFEFRVWVQYILSADDFGVMRASAVTLQSANDALHGKPQKVVSRALEHIIEHALLHTFEHQNRRYVYQRNWQDFQKVEYPRPTIEPQPPDDQLALCTEPTRLLFAKHPGGKGRRKPDGSPNGSQIITEPIPTTRARACETAKATAHGSGFVLSEREPEREPTARSKRPIFSGQRLTVFEWMLDDCSKTLGEHFEAFGLDEWFSELDAQAVSHGLVIPKRDGGAWLQAQLVAEAQRRGIPLRLATPPQAGKQTTRLAAAVANIRAEAGR